jgi:cell division protease FtsH
MSDKMGPLTFGKGEEHIFLGREVARPKDFSEETAVLIDSEIKRIVIECATRARHMIETNLEKLHALARALLERESLDGEEIYQIIQKAMGKELPRKLAAPKAPQQPPPPMATPVAKKEDEKGGTPGLIPVPA